MQHRLQERGCSTGSEPLCDRKLIGTDTVGGIAVEIRVVRQTRFLCGLHPCRTGCIVIAQIRYRQLTLAASQPCVSFCIGFQLFEVWQHFVE